MIRTKIVGVALFLFVALTAFANPQFGHALLFNDDWKFNLSDIKEASNLSFNNVQRVFHGRLIAYVQAKGQEGEVKVRFSAPWLKMGSKTLTVK